VGHSDAYDLLYKLAKRSEIREKDILGLHKLFYFRIDPSNAGKYRKVRVFISGTDFTPPPAQEVPALMDDFVAVMQKVQAQVHPVEYAARFHFDFVSIHPFIDGNGRCARLLMNLALLQKGGVITIIPPAVRKDYIGALVQSQKQKDCTSFVNFISAMVYESQKEYLRLVRALRE